MGGVYISDTNHTHILAIIAENENGAQVEVREEGEGEGVDGGSGDVEVEVEGDFEGPIQVVHLVFRVRLTMSSIWLEVV